ncbi:hypothetical protein L484_013022 [Morus notabilis]|uniref:Uncharacterized protein n=1 Tax=Morus notabilis TaxID=981085 RepID=W9SKF0_9ROSA|nr:hypothetical protein L484_013022 [Morus notabilis]
MAGRERRVRSDLTPFLRNGGLRKRIRSSLTSFLRNDGTKGNIKSSLYSIPSEWRDAKGGDPSSPLNPLPFPLLIFIRFVLHIREALPAICFRPLSKSFPLTPLPPNSRHPWLALAKPSAPSA